MVAGVAPLEHRGRAASSAGSATTAGRAAASVSPIRTEPSAPRLLPAGVRLGLEHQEQRQRRVLRQAAAWSPARCRRPRARRRRAPVQRLSSCAKHPSNRCASRRPRPCDQRSHRAQPATRTGKQIAQDEAVGAGSPGGQPRRPWRRGAPHAARAPEPFAARTRSRRTAKSPPASPRSAASRCGRPVLVCRIRLRSPTTGI